MKCDNCGVEKYLGHLCLPIDGAISKSAPAPGSELKDLLSGPVILEEIEDQESLGQYLLKIEPDEQGGWNLFKRHQAYEWQWSDSIGKESAENYLRDEQYQIYQAR